MSEYAIEYWFKFPLHLFCVLTLPYLPKLLDHEKINFAQIANIQTIIS